MSRPVAFVIVGILATVSTLVRLSSDVHVHNVLLHQRLVHETFLAIFTFVASFVVADMLVSHVDVKVFHLCSTDATRFPGVDFLLVFIQLMLVCLHHTTVRTLYSFRVMVSLKVTPQMLRSLSFKATMVTYLLVCLHMPLQLQFCLKTILAASFRAGQPSHVDHLHVSLLLGEPNCPGLGKTTQIWHSEGAWQVWAIAGKVFNCVNHFVPLNILCGDVSTAIWT